MIEEKLKRYAKRVGYTETEMESFRESGHRIRQIERLPEAAPLYSIVAEVVEARHCNSGHMVGQRLILDVDGSFISKLCPSRMCVYLLSQLAIPVALINERLSSEKLADIAVKTDAAALLVFRAAWAHDEGSSSIGREASIAKLYS